MLLRANNTVLFDRLKARGYNEKKISENIECEILEVTKEEVEKYLLIFIIAHIILILYWKLVMMKLNN